MVVVFGRGTGAATVGVKGSVGVTTALVKSLLNAGRPISTEFNTGGIARRQSTTIRIVVKWSISDAFRG